MINPSENIQSSSHWKLHNRLISAVRVCSWKLIDCLAYGLLPLKRWFTLVLLHLHFWIIFYQFSLKLVFLTQREVKWLKRFKAKRVIHLASHSLSKYWSSRESEDFGFRKIRSQSGRIIWYIYFCSLERYKNAVNKRHFYTDSIENKKKSFCSTNYLISSKWKPPRNGPPIEKC